MAASRLGTAGTNVYILEWEMVHTFTTISDSLGTLSRVNLRCKFESHTLFSHIQVHPGVTETASLLDTAGRNVTLKREKVTSID